jgi:hypothetical protein
MFGQPLFATPKVSLGRFHGTDDTVRMMRDYALGPEGESNFKVRQWGERIIAHVAPKDYLSEILAVRAWATNRNIVRYTNDARHVEQVKTPVRSLLEIEQNGVTLVDCDDIATLIGALGMSTGKEASFVIVGFGAPEEYTHVFCRLREPKTGEWIVCDPVAGPNELQMLQRVSTYKIVEVD